MTYPRIGLIGCGNMGQCLVLGLPREQPVWIFDKHSEKMDTIQKSRTAHLANSAQAVCDQVDVLLLATKPSALPDLCHSLHLRPNTLIISIAAGVTCHQIKKWGRLTTHSVVRAMPNTPALCGAGATGLYTPQPLSNSLKTHITELFTSVGLVVWVDRESDMDTITALSGSGPAYFFYWMSGLLEAAQACGLPEDIARALIIQTAFGAVQLSKENPDFDTLRRQVTSKGGTTEAGIRVLETHHQKTILLEMVQAAKQRSQQLSEELSA